MSIAAPRVLIIGAGPAGLAAAAALAQRGIAGVRIVDREPEPGGIPRFCPHPTFGIADYLRPMPGPSWINRLVARIDQRQLSLNTTVTAISSDLEVSLSDHDGESQLRPERILLTTGIRETPRSARLISGDRPLNVITTGALQRMVATGQPLPFRRPLIVGTELVSFSAALTLRDQRIRAVAMVESGERIRARRPADLLTRLFLGIPVMTGHSVVSINAEARNASLLRSVTLRGHNQQLREINCDAVIFTGEFVPEASLLAAQPSLMNAASGGPGIDQCWRLENQRIYAAGNVLRGVETAGWSAAEGKAAGLALADDLEGRLPVPVRRIPLLARDAVKLVSPSAIAVPGPAPDQLHMCVRMARAATGRLTLSADGRTLWRSQRFTALPERRLRVTRELPNLDAVAKLSVGFEEQD